MKYVWSSYFLWTPLCTKPLDDNVSFTHVFLDFPVPPHRILATFSTSASPFLPRSMLHARFFPSIIWIRWSFRIRLYRSALFVWLVWRCLGALLFALLEIHLLEGILPLPFLSFLIHYLLLITPPSRRLDLFFYPSSFLRIYCCLLHVLGFSYLLIFFLLFPLCFSLFGFISILSMVW